MRKILVFTIVFFIALSASTQQDNYHPWKLGFSFSAKNFSLIEYEPNVLWLDGEINYSPGADFNLNQQWTNDIGISVELIEFLSTYQEKMHYTNMVCSPGEICAWNYNGRKTLIGLGIGFGYTFRKEKRFSFGPNLNLSYVKPMLSNGVTTRYIGNSQGGNDPEITNDLSILSCRGNFWGRAGIKFDFRMTDHLGFSIAPTIEHGTTKLNCVNFSTITISKTELRIPIGVFYLF